MWCLATNTFTRAVGPPCSPTLLPRWNEMIRKLFTVNFLKPSDLETVCWKRYWPPRIKVRCSIGLESTAPFPPSQSFSPAIFLAICESDHPHLIDALQPVIKNMSGRKADTCCSRGPTARTPCLRCQHARAPARSLVPVPYFAPQEASSKCRKIFAAATCIRLRYIAKPVMGWKSCMFSTRYTVILAYTHISDQNLDMKKRFY